MRTVDDIERDVEDEPKWDPNIAPSDIGVATKDGAVTLSGFRTRRRCLTGRERSSFDYVLGRSVAIRVS
ncbi:hypothetical protein AWB76_04788 [Caballeronia temeraria]|uniref:Uncharacterized protein n=1 Tax=Caballeronia temeraria TaxID=1777137 RepID=A0A158BWY4_9BURK|nr:hypothetical protein AWB76_04788 [Caballeronia temeraria]